MKINLKLTTLLCVAATIAANATASEITDATTTDSQQTNYNTQGNKYMISSTFSNDLLNTPLGSEKSVDLILTNNSNVTRENLRIRYDQYIPYAPPSGMLLLGEAPISSFTRGTFCQQGQKLEAKASCIFRVVYRPDQAASGTTAFSITTQTPNPPNGTSQFADFTGTLDYSTI